MLPLHARRKVLGGRAPPRAPCLIVRLWLLLKVFASDLCSLPESCYDDDRFQVIKFKFIGNLEVVDVVESITLYLKQVRGLAQKLENVLGDHVP